MQANYKVNHVGISRHNLYIAVFNFHQNNLVEHVGMNLTTLEEFKKEYTMNSCVAIFKPKSK